MRVADYGIKLYLNQTLATAEQALRTGRYDDVIRDDGEMDLITQQNAALVEQTSAAAENLKQQASILRNALAEFEVQGADEPESATL